MKSTEDTVRMDIDFLEHIADSPDIRIPENLESRLESAVIASEIAKDKGREKSFRLVTAIWVPAVAVAAAVAILLAIPTQPKDTFSDPEAAYAALDNSFKLISHKMDNAINILK